MDKRFIIVGTGWAGTTIASALLAKNPANLIGFVDDKPRDIKIIIPNGGKDYEVPVLGPSNQLLSLLKKFNGNSVVLARCDDREEALLGQIVACHENGIPIYEMPDLYARLTQKIPVRHIDHQWIIPNLTTPPNDLYSFLHDATNYFFTLVGLVSVLLPLLPLISLAIKLDSPGPVFYRQRRPGKNGHPFYLLKFRTMQQNADKEGAAWTTKGDTRITRVGKWLRKFRLDELPQFINVLKGDMSLIGPRPEPEESVKLFKSEIPFYEFRHLVRPGITGWAQVNYMNTSSIEGAVEKLQYDFYWIKNRSLLLDLKIIFKSIKVILTGFGSV